MCLQAGTLQVVTSTTIRVSEATRARLAALADEVQRPMTSVVDEALDALERRRFFTAMNQRYRELRDDDDAWGQIEAERAAEAGSLADSTG
jgi:predicted transcriptional regulator